jgi:4'-phosphopantetheinyl transferase
MGVANSPTLAGKSSTSSWNIPLGEVTLGSNEVHVWRAALDRLPEDTHNFWQTLSSDECARAARFHFDKDRDRFVTGRGLLRTILARYLQVEPVTLRFEYTAYGKPYLATAFNTRIRFNLSHSRGLALYALAYDRALGVDLEYIDPEFAQEEVAERFFSAREVASLRSLPSGLQPEAFFHCWTRKEAYIKASGEGLSLPLDRFDVSLLPGQEAALLCTYDDPQEAVRWLLRNLELEPGYAAAIAVERRDWQLKCWEWPG